MAPTPTRLRFGIVSSDSRLPAWAGQCVRQLRSCGAAELVLWIRDAAQQNGSSWEYHGVLHRLYRRHWLERRSTALAPVELAPELGAAQRLDCAASGAGCDARALQQIRELGLDFILCFDDRALASELLEVARLGVWSYEHAISSAPYFREVLEGSARTRVELLQRRPGRTTSLYRGFFGTCQASWVNTIERAFWGSTDWCARVCAELSALGPERFEQSRSLTSDGAAAAPRNRELLGLLTKSARSSLEKLWELLFHVEVWNVGIAAESLEQILRQARIDEASVTWCGAHSPGNFIADPFSYVQDGKACVLVEDYVDGKGRICTLSDSLVPERVGLSVDLDLPYHMSYPCIFTEGGETYCVPETYQAGHVSLYKRAGRQWVLVRTLLEGKPVVDPTLFKHEGRYWLLFTLQDDGAWGNQKLYAYYADSLDSEWKPHLLNPVKCDIGSTRPAGSPFVVNGVLYRPSQDCSQTYGGAVVINELRRLSPSEFVELEAARIEPMKNGPYPAGLHTLNPMGEQAVFDSKKFSFDWLAWRKNWSRLHEVFR
ncbi:MAG TPA: hypothetical protein VFS67_10420 [Polyangiaceae bacterium]|nr:hypothetical protein [Polyangiaceae bacterium]